jgi:hypothetical protein
VGPIHFDFVSSSHTSKNDSGIMEKKVTKKFYSLSALNLITALVLGWGVVMDTLVLVAILIALVMNHTILVKIISELAASLTSENANAKHSLKRVLGLMFAKMMLLGTILVLAYFYNQAMVPKVMVLMIFQLIIQVVSIKNNY